MVLVTNQEPDTSFPTGEKKQNYRFFLPFGTVIRSNMRVNVCNVPCLPTRRIMDSRLADINSVNNFLRTRKFLKFLTPKNDSKLMGEVRPWKLNAWEEFIITVRKKDSNKDYEPSSLRSLMASCEPCSTKREIKDTEFDLALNAFQFKQKDLKQKGKEKIPNASDALTEEEIKLFYDRSMAPVYDKKLLGTLTAEALLNTTDLVGSTTGSTSNSVFSERPTTPNVLQMERNFQSIRRDKLRLELAKISAR